MSKHRPETVERAAVDTRHPAGKKLETPDAAR